MNCLFVLGGGIGNIVQATPSINLLSKSGFCVDLCLFCNSSQDLDVFKISSVNNLYINKYPDVFYDYQLVGPFVPTLVKRSKIILTSKINYAQHLPESEVYRDMIKQIGINIPLEDIEINFLNGSDKIDNDTIAIYPGCKSNWSMKRWDKYDALSEKFDKVMVFGTDEDINSHGNPPWINRKYNWPKHVNFYKSSLKNVAHAISQCKFFIGNDGGLSHIAAATGIKTFVLFGPSSIIKNKPLSKNCYAITLNLECSPCQFRKDQNGKQIFASNKNDCPFNLRCMKDMSVNFVFEKINSFLK